jgi:2-amino-4-hydroxy-6-hydroxymethyldihydropteridine diphosphokinase
MGKEKHMVYLGLGSNIQPETYLPRAIDCLKKMLKVVQVSSIWQTRAVGSEGPDFLNAVIGISTELKPEELKEQVAQKIEDELGRVRTEDKYAPRTIDIDLLVYDTQIIDEEIWEYAHLAVPLAELLPELMDSNTRQSLGATAKKFRHNVEIKPRPDIQPQ